MGDFFGGVADGFGSLLDGLGGILGGGSGGTTPAPSSGGMSNTGLWGPLLQGGLGLAGIYFDQSGKKSLAEQAAAQRMAEIEAMKAKGGGGGGGGGAALKAAKMAQLSQLYQNWAQLEQKGGSDIMTGAIKTGEAAQGPIMASIGRLR